MNRSVQAHFKALFCVGDAILILLCIAAALFTGALLSGRENGGYAEVTTPDDSFSLSLAVPLTRTVEGRDGHTLTLEIAGGKIRVQSADCPDRLCVNTGWIGQAGQTAACLPAGVIVTVRGGDDGGYDAVAR